VSIKQQLDLKKLPRHVAVIMDGNGRWAKQKGENRIFGHRNGVQSVSDVAEACAELGDGIFDGLCLQHRKLEPSATRSERFDDTLLLKTMGGELKTLLEK
jgi:undecaprenyl diphosphate synthase